MNLSFEVPYANEVDDYDNWQQVMRDGYVLEMHVVDHCNLNCAGCNHFSPLAKEYFVTKEDFTAQMTQLRKVLPNLRRINLLGGEPFLHPELYDFCVIVKNIFPTTKIQILTNGIILNQHPEWVDKYIELGVGLSISGYPGVDISKVQEYSKDYPEMCWDHFNTRMIFTHTTVDLKGQQPSFTEREYCGFHSLPLLTLKDYRIYVCPFAAHINLFNQSGYEQVPLCEKDYLDIRKEGVGIEDLIRLCIDDKDICRYCRSYDTHDESLWRPSTRKRKEFMQTQAELFAEDYAQYEKVYNDLSLIKRYEENGYIDHIDKNYAISCTKFLLDRYYGRGKIDIIIPFYKVSQDIIDRLYDNITHQTIINDCIIYLVSDGSPDELVMANRFVNPKLNVVLLKTPYHQGIEAARSLGLEKSTNRYVFFLEPTDLLIQYSGLEELYKVMESNPVDYVQGITAIFTNGQFACIDDKNTRSRLYSREFLLSSKDISTSSICDKQICLYNREK